MNKIKAIVLVFVGVAMMGALSQGWSTATFHPPITIGTSGQVPVAAPTDAASGQATAMTWSSFVPGCKAPITSSGGAGTFTNACVTTTSLCVAQDITTPAHTAAVVVAAPGAGSVAYTGATGTEVVVIGCI